MKRPLVGLLLTLSALVLAAGFARLGLWQLERAQQKEALLADYARSASAAPVELERWRPQPRYQPVRIDGRFLAAPLVLLDNQVYQGRPGVHVLQVFAPAGGGEKLVVDRGWLAMRADRSVADVEARDDRTLLPGLLRDPIEPGLRLGEVRLTAGSAPQRVPWIDLDQLADVLNSPVAPQILLSTDAGDDRLVRDWEPRLMPPDRHRAYAFQWFSLAATVVVVWLVLYRRARRKSSHAHGAK